MAFYSVDACTDIVPTKLRKQSSVPEDTYKSTYQLVHSRPSSAPVKVLEYPLYTPRAGPGRNEGNFTVGSNNSHLFGPSQNGFIAGSPTRDEEVFRNSLRKYDSLKKRSNEHAQKDKIISLAKDFIKPTGLCYKKATTNGLKESKFKQNPKTAQNKAQMKIEIPTKDTLLPTAHLKNNVFLSYNVTDGKLMIEQNDLMYDYLKTPDPPRCSRIKDEIKVYKCDVNKSTCPALRQRYHEHKLLHHNRMENTATGSEGPNVATKDMNAGTSTMSLCSTFSKLINICCNCMNALPCACGNQDKIISINDELSKKINEWANTIPVLSNESQQDKLLRERSINQLQINLSKIPTGPLFKDESKNEIQKWLENMPMWLPSNKLEQELLIDKLSDNLVTKIETTSCDQDRKNEIVNKQLESIINQWARRIPINPNESKQDESKRKRMLSHLKNTLQKQISNGVFHSSGKTEIEKYLNNIPIHIKDNTKLKLIKHQMACSLFDQLDNLGRKKNSRESTVPSFKELDNASFELLSNNDQIDTEQEKIFDNIIDEWALEIPVKATETATDKSKRNEKINKLKDILNSIQEESDLEGKVIKIVKTFLKSLPMWHPPDKSEELEVLVENELADLLINKIKTLLANDSLKRPRKRWNSDVQIDTDISKQELADQLAYDKRKQSNTLFVSEQLHHSKSNENSKIYEEAINAEVRKWLKETSIDKNFTDDMICQLVMEISDWQNFVEEHIDLKDTEVKEHGLKYLILKFLSRGIDKRLLNSLLKDINNLVKKLNGLCTSNVPLMDKEFSSSVQKQSNMEIMQNNMSRLKKLNELNGFRTSNVPLVDKEFSSSVQTQRNMEIAQNSMSTLKEFNGLRTSNVPLVVKEFSSSIQTQSNMEITKNNMSRLSADLKVLLETLLNNVSDNPCYEEINIAMRTELEKEIILRICALNQNPEIFNDDVLFETLLCEDMQDILDSFLPNKELKEIKPAIKTKIIELVKASRRRIKNELSKHKYRKKLGDKISDIVLSNAFFAEKDSLEVFKQKIIELFIRLSNEQDKSEEKKKITQKFIKEIDNFITTHPGCFDIRDPDKFIFKLFTSLSSIRVPNKLALKSLINEIAFKEIINDWTNELPLQQNLKSEEQLAIQNTTLILAKRLHSIEINGQNKSKTNYENKIKSEICNWLQKMPLKPGINISQYIVKFANNYKSKIASIREKFNTCACDIFSESRNTLSFNSTSFQLPSVLTPEDRAHLQRIRDRSSVSTQMCTKSDYAIESPCLTRNCSVSCQAKVSFDDQNHFCDISDIPFPYEPRTESVCLSPMSDQSLNDQSGASQSSSDPYSSPACVSGCSTPKNICSTSTSPMCLCVTPTTANKTPKRKSKTCTQKCSNISIIKRISSCNILNQIKKHCCNCKNELIYPNRKRFTPREIEARSKICSKRCCKRPTRHTINGASSSSNTQRYLKCCGGFRCPHPCNRYFS